MQNKKQNGSNIRWTLIAKLDEKHDVEVDITPNANMDIKVDVA